MGFHLFVHVPRQIIALGRGDRRRHRRGAWRRPEPLQLIAPLILELVLRHPQTPPPLNPMVERVLWRRTWSRTGLRLAAPRRGPRGRIDIHRRRRQTPLPERSEERERIKERAARAAVIRRRSSHDP